MILFLRLNIHFLDRLAFGRLLLHGEEDHVGLKVYIVEENHDDEVYKHEVYNLSILLVHLHQPVLAAKYIFSRRKMEAVGNIK